MYFRRASTWRMDTGNTCQLTAAVGIIHGDCSCKPWLTCRTPLAVSTGSSIARACSATEHMLAYSCSRDYPWGIAAVSHGLTSAGCPPRSSTLCSASPCRMKAYFCWASGDALPSAMPENIGFRIGDFFYSTPSERHQSLSAIGSRSASKGVRLWQQWQQEGKERRCLSRSPPCQASSR